MRLLLDSNVYSELMHGQARVADLVRTAEEDMLSAVLVGELMYGFRRGSRFERNAADLRPLLKSHTCLSCPWGRLPQTATPESQCP